MIFYRIHTTVPNGQHQWRFFASKEKAEAEMTCMASEMEKRWDLHNPSTKLQRYKDIGKIHYWWETPLGTLAWRADMEQMITEDHNYDQAAMKEEAK